MRMNMKKKTKKKNKDTINMAFVACEVGDQCMSSVFIHLRRFLCVEVSKPAGLEDYF